MISALEIRRRMFHLIGGSLLVGSIHFKIIDKWWILGFFIFAIILGLVAKKVKVPIAHWFFKKFDRPKDYKKFPGKGFATFLAGCGLAVWLFPLDIATAAIIILAVGDTIAPIVGQYGDVQNPFNKKKYVEGSIAGALVAGLVATLFVPPLQAGLAAVFAMIAEGIGLKLGRNQLDDNFVIPLVAGGVMLLLRLI